MDEVQLGKLTGVVTKHVFSAAVRIADAEISGNTNYRLIHGVEDVVCNDGRCKFKQAIPQGAIGYDRASEGCERRAKWERLNTESWQHTVGEGAENDRDCTCYVKDPRLS